MDPFEFLIGLYTIIIGLGISLLVHSVGQMIEGKTRVRRYWVHSFWIVLIFVAHVVSWFALWQYHGNLDWNVLEALLLLLVPITLYLVSYLAVPEITELGKDQHDMRTFYYGRHRLLQGLMALAVILMMINDALIMNTFTTSGAQIGRFAVLLVLVPGIISARPAIHAAQVVILLIHAGIGSPLYGFHIN
jgi:hypothetical protein